MDRFQAAARILAALFACALIWALLRFGATELPSLYLFFLTLAVLAVGSDLLLPPLRIAPLAAASFAAVGGLLLARIAFGPSLEGRGYVFLAVGWLALFLGARIAMAGSAAARFLILALVLLGAFEAAYGLFQALAGHDFIGSYARDLGRIATGTLINRNHYAGFLNLVLPLALALLLVGPHRERAPVRSSERLAAIWLGLLGAALMSLAVLLSLSRGGTVVLLAVVVYLIAVFYFRERRRGASRLPRAGLWILLALLLVLGSAVGLEALGGRFARIESEVTRLAVYRDTLELVTDHPLSGVGPGMYRWSFRPYQTVQTQAWYEHAHNDYLETAAEWGLPLALLFWAGIFWIWWRAVRAGLGGSRDSPLLLGASAAIFSVLVHSAFDFILRTPVNWAVFGVLVGLVWALTRPAEAASAGSRTTVALRLALALLLVLAGWRVVERYRAEVLTDSAESVNELERAAALDATLPEAWFKRGLRERDAQGRPAHAQTTLETAVELNPHHWIYRLELARTYELVGEDELAERAYEAALELDPKGSFLLWNLANFRLRRGRLEPALEAAGRAVGLDPDLRKAAFRLLRRAGATSAEIAAHWPADRRARFELMRLAVDDGDAPEEWIAKEWDRLAAGPPPLPIRETAFLFRHLLELGAGVEARSLWIDLQRLHGTRDPAFEEGRNVVWNGGFEAELTDHPMDWRIGDAEHFTVRRAARADGGGTALVVTFDGTENLAFAGVLQRVLVPAAKELELSCSLRAEGLTSDKGVFVRVVGAGGAELLATPPLLGTTDWTAAGGRFRSGDGAGITIVVSRRPSRRLGGRLAGSVWIDDVVVRPIGEPEGPVE